MNNSIVTSDASSNFTMDLFDVIPRLCLSTFSFLVGLPAHSYVVWLIIKGKGGVESKFFNFNFSICEIGTCLKGLFILLSFWFSSLKALSQILQGLSATGRPLFQCLICVERYLAVVHPVTFLKYKPLRYRVICCAVAWMITLGSCLSSFFILMPSHMTIYTWFFLVQYLLFFSIQLFCLVAVLRALKQSGPGERGREKEEENPIKRRAFFLILISTVSMAIIYVPYTVTGIIVIITQQYFVGLWFPALFCYVLAGFVQPVLFLSRAGKLPFFL